MKRRIKNILMVTHLTMLGLGFGAGIYILPILTAQEDAAFNEIEEVKREAKYSAHFTKNQNGSDALHWANGDLYVSERDIAFRGEVAPGPDYKIYLTKTQAFDGDSFLEMKKDAVLVGELKNFGNFRKAVPLSVDINEFTTVQIWCERFSKFIGSAKYGPGPLDPVDLLE